MDTENCSLIDLSLVASLAIAAENPKSYPGYRPFVLVPNGDGGMDLELLSPEHEAPLADFIKQRIEIIDIESYIAYIKKFKTSTTAIFAIASDNGANFVTVLDYHEG